MVVVMMTIASLQFRWVCRRPPAPSGSNPDAAWPCVGPEQTILIITMMMIITLIMNIIIVVTMIDVTVTMTLLRADTGTISAVKDFFVIG